MIDSSKLGVTSCINQLISDFGIFSKLCYLSLYLKPYLMNVLYLQYPVYVSKSWASAKSHHIKMLVLSLWSCVRFCGIPVDLIVNIKIYMAQFHGLVWSPFQSVDARSFYASTDVKRIDKSFVHRHLRVTSKAVNLRAEWSWAFALFSFHILSHLNIQASDARPSGLSLCVCLHRKQKTMLYGFCLSLAWA